MTSALDDVRHRNLGRMPYRAALARMRDLHARVAEGGEPGTILTVEHEPVVTLGRQANRAHLFFSDEALAARGVDSVSVERGGDVTYHGPGMLVVYPILKLARFREIVPVVSALEEATIAMLATFGLAASTRGDHRGVYVNDRSIAAIGLAVAQMTTMHGLALDVDSGLQYDRLISPCGMPYGITSLAHELGRPVTLDEARAALLPVLAEKLGITLAQPVK